MDSVVMVRRSLGVFGRPAPPFAEIDANPHVIERGCFGVER